LVFIATLYPICKFTDGSWLIATWRIHGG
jgi:hypothetical protein